ncbi:hypothetical protein ACWDOP_15095 [Nocardia sp. NPDC003693]
MAGQSPIVRLRRPRRKPAAATHSAIRRLPRRALWLFAAFFVLFVFPGLVGAVAGASSGESQIDGIGWMDVRDSQGVPLANYRIVTDHGSVLAPYNTVLWTIIGLEATGYLIFVGTGIWLLGYVLSFRWLDVIATPLRMVADTLSGQIATPIMLVTAATIGAFCVAWFILRGYPGKAATQVVTMFAVAILGPVFLADPLAEVLSAHGWLAQGRDVGISVAAGLTGDANPDPSAMIPALQTTMVDNFARNPMQVWNFGHVIDDRPACRAAWSAGIAAGDDDQVREGLRNCDAAAHARAEEPSMGQVGTGLILLICAVLLLSFAIVLSVRIMKAAMDSIFHAFGAIFGFAAGGFVYGATQTHLIRSLVHSAVSAARMALYVIFLSLYMMVISRIFAQAGGQVLSVFVIVAIVEVIAISQLKTLSNSLNQGNDWIANRFALAIQSGMSRTAASGSTGTALGMGTMHAAGTAATGLGLVTGLTALNTFNTSPVTAWLAGRTVNPLNPLARARKTLELENMGMAPLSHEFQRWNELERQNWVGKALSRSKGEVTGLAAANVLDGLYDSKAPENMHAAVMLRAGFSHEQIMGAQHALAVQGASRMTDPEGVGAAQKAVAAAYAARNYGDDGSRDKWEPIAAQAVVAADNFARHAVAPVNPAAVDRVFLTRVLNASAAPNAATALAAIAPDEWRAAGKDTLWAIGDRLATQHRKLAQRYHDTLVGKAPAGGPSAQLLRDQLFSSANRISNLHDHTLGTGFMPWRH